MEIKLGDHENYHHCDLMLHKDLPLSAKTIMAIWLFKQKRFPDEMLNEHMA
jgi:hypothetical protein